MKNEIKDKVNSIFTKLYGDKDIKSSVPLFNILIECGFWPRPLDRRRLVNVKDGKDVIQYYLTDNSNFFNQLPEDYICRNCKDNYDCKNCSLNETKYKIVWQTNGFESKDLPEEEWDTITEEFMRIRNAYCDLANGKNGYDQINHDFEIRYPYIKQKGEQNVDGYLYRSYVAWRVNDLIREKKFDKDWWSELLEPFIFMDGSIPDIGMRLKKHGNWTMSLLLQEVPNS